jgi:hypothetical protein
MTEGFSGTGFVIAWLFTILAFGVAIASAKSGLIGPRGARSTRGLALIGAVFGFAAGLAMPVGLSGRVDGAGIATALVVMAIGAVVFRYVGPGL